MTSVSKEFQCNQDVSEEKNLWDKILEGVGNGKGDGKGTVQSSPTMVFSVIGDSDSFVPRPWPKTVFQTALIEAAKSGGETWILYSGAEQGVSKVVRDAYKYYEDMEFKTKSFKKKINDPDRRVKLISMAGNKTNNSATQKGKSFIEVKPMKPTVFKTTSGKGNNFLLNSKSSSLNKLLHSSAKNLTLECQYLLLLLSVRETLIR